MKKQIVLLAILIASLSTYSQVSFSVPVGVSTLKTPTIGANLSLRLSGFIIAGGFDSHISKNIEKGDFFWSRIGGAFNLTDLNTLEVSAGMGSYYRSSDNKSLNEGLGLVNVQYVHQMESRPEGALFCSITATQKFTMFTGGLRFIFGRGQGKQRYGCPSANVR